MFYESEIVFLFFFFLSLFTVLLSSFDLLIEGILDFELEMFSLVQIKKLY